MWEHFIVYPNSSSDGLSDLFSGGELCMLVLSKVQLGRNVHERRKTQTNVAGRPGHTRF